MNLGVDSDSPEIWKETGYSEKMDIWSLGCLVYEISALKLPFDGKTLYNLMDKIQECDYEELPEYYSPEMKQLVKICLSVEPENRPSCGKFLHTKRQFLTVYQMRY